MNSRVQAISLAFRDRLLVSLPRCLPATAAFLLLLAGAIQDASAQVSESGADGSSQSSNPFFAFCMDTHDAQKRSLQQQALMLAELGFDGAGHVGLDNVAERLKTLDDAGLRLFLLGLRISLTDDDRQYLPKIKEVVPLLKGRNAMLYLTIGGLKPSDPTGHDVAVPLLREIARIAADSQVRVVLYPHTGDWLVKVDHAVDLAGQVDEPNLGVMFNLCHFLKNEKESTLSAAIAAARPHLFAVSINGADLAGRADNNWNRLIQPLDRGTFDNYQLLKTLKAQGYSGPIALMCYGIGGDARQHLARSMTHWRRLQAQLAVED